MTLRLVVYLLIIPFVFFKNCSKNQENRDQAAQLPANPVNQIPERMHVMSFNIRFDNPDDGENAWPYRRQFVASLIRSHADLVGTQEGVFRQLEDLEELLAVNTPFRYDRVGISRDGYTDKGEFCAIFFRSDRYDLLAHDTFWLSENPDEPGYLGWDAALPRIVTWARLRHKSSDRTFYVFNAHFDHRGSEAREQSARLLLKKVDEIAGNEPVIVMGDLNADEDQEPYKILADVDRGPVRVELLDGFYHAENGHEGPSSTWNGFSEIVENRRIDFIFANPQLRIIEHRILTDTKDGRFPSDHFPVVAELAFR